MIALRLAPLILLTACMTPASPTSAPPPSDTAALPVPSALAARGVQRFRFAGWAGPPLAVWYVRPQGAGADAPVLFVFHGVRRDADRYLGEWLDLAERHRAVVVVPEFDREGFAGAAGYNHGRVLDTGGGLTPPERRTFAVIEPIFDAIVTREQLGARDYVMFGHSAGAQFVHRFVMTGNGERLRRAISANAGSYMFPSDTYSWPFGLGGLPPGLWSPDAYARPMTVLLGTADNDPNYPSLPRDADAMRQGPHRLTRGRTFFALALSDARRAGATFAWSCGEVAGVGHENGRMAPAAAALLFDNAPLAACEPPTKTSDPER